MNTLDQSEFFIQKITESQNRIYGYVFSLVGDHHRAAEIVQDTNLVLWRKSNEYRTEQPFLPWAFGIARNQILANIRDRKRDRMLLDAELAETLAEQAETQTSHLESMQYALRHCLKKLNSRNRKLVESRYLKMNSIAGVAEESGRTTGAIKVALLKIRRVLGECIHKQLASES